MTPTPQKTRRSFLTNLGKSTFSATVLLSTACSEDPSTPTPNCTSIQPEHPIGTLNTADPEFPMRQHDPRWGSEIMYDRDLVIQGLTELNGERPADAQEMIREYEDGNNLSNEGCQISALAMALRLFQPTSNPPWTPSYLNELAQYFYYYTPSAISLVPPYADLLSDVTEGLVQIALKEEYLSGVPTWPKYHVDTSPLVRAYRSLPADRRSSYLLMLKTGTWDDTIASHYVLLHPDDTSGPDDRDPLILDPAMPLDKSGAWRLSDSAKAILEDPGIAQEWQDKQIENTQISGVWVIVKWQDTPRQVILAPLISAWAQELSRQSP